MIIENTDLDGVFLVKPTIHKDDRGYFFESYRDDKFKNCGLSLKFCQENQTKSNKGTLRGLHYQLRYPQGKLVRVSLGEVYDVAVDVRLNSPTFGQYYGTILSDHNHLQLYVPPGFAHGYIVRSETAIFQYKCTDYYNPLDEAALLWNDPDLAIIWPEVEEVKLSKKDSNALSLKELLR